MAGFVKDVTPRPLAIDLVSEKLSFPWHFDSVAVPLEMAGGCRLAEDIFCSEQYPPYTRSLRDGYAVCSQDVVAATVGTPTFLQSTKNILMGTKPDFKITSGEAAAIPTGGLLPEGADAVVMAEDTSLTGGFVEVRAGVQSGENIISAGEELKTGQLILNRGDLVDFRTISLLSTLGVGEVRAVRPRISILSTGDEIVPVETSPLPPGKIRDVNGWSVRSVLTRCGFEAEYRGIVSDDGEEFERRFAEELERCDVLILSGGSSVGTRDRCSQVLEGLHEPGLIVRGVNIVPGKPTLIAGCTAQKKLAVSLPGHPLSCLTVAYVLLVPLLLRLIGAKNQKFGHRLFLELAKDITARTGPEKFMPGTVDEDGRIAPVLAKSGYVSPLSKSDGLIRIPEDRETLRAGKKAEVWIW